MQILLADDHPLFREGVKPVLQKLDAQVEVLEAVDYPSAYAITAQHSDMDLALLDLNMPGGTGIDGITQFRRRFPDIPLIVLSAADQPDEVRQVLAAGAMGYISKAAAPAVIVSAIHLVMAGGVYAPPDLLSPHTTTPTLPTHPASPSGPRLSSLTERQLDVVRLIAQGMSNRQIAEALHLTEGTVKIHVTAVLRALDAANRTEAVLVAQKAGLA
ncbi:MAG: response regulator transcription factor [Betaproteobacteria bacterium]|nr:response regulator transcription factor [Betaproteobacteria bacterium]